MATRTIGQSTLQVAPLMLGGNVFGWTANEAASFSILDAFVDAGLNFIDTADVYSAWVPGNQGGESETLIGKWLTGSGKRDRVVIATKVAKHTAKRPGLSSANIQAAIEDSLRRLQTDYVDIYFSHEDDPNVPIEETLGAYQKLIQAGKVRVIGASNFSGARTLESLRVADANGLPRYQILQPEYNLYSRAAYEAELEPIAVAEHLGVVPYYSLASGFLSGKYRSVDDLSKSVRGGRGVPKYLNPRGMAILAALDQVAERQGVTQASVALAWLIARPSITAPIVSATSAAQVDSFAQAVRLKLDASDIQALDGASAQAQA
ncbi:aldo/keto reductase [Bordetella sp. FB-8]|uniref:aldo/keto reductase n=1 Tax=Bordetella sp. FB-8 TaxID=1159870 RepID=UPI0012DEEB2C|nr:aldo/keto reductase [Bordetella sp. FB-8]